MLLIPCHQEKRSLIDSLPTLTALLTRPQSAAVIVGCDRMKAS
ncbi:MULTISPECIES: hypothetical protein [Cyanophyceae]|nr:hypothetical protein [Trichocoleus sp. FACHB-40]